MPATIASTPPLEARNSTARIIATAPASRFRAVPDFKLTVSAIREAIDYQESAHIERHRFFQMAEGDSDALRLWAEQEFLTSAAFSQILSIWIATIDNFHVRTCVIPVLVGEHHRLVDGVAFRCHPNLAANLCTSLGTNFDSLRPIDATIAFIDEMEDSAQSTMHGAGFLGVGNERLLIPEYGAVRRAFQAALPDSAFVPFLDANISEDVEHSALIEQAAAALVSIGDDDEEFLRGAIAGVDSRLRYYDRLVEALEQPN